MKQHFPQGLRVGGSALPDGVMMLTPLAAAIVRENENGEFSVHSFPLPERKPHPLEKLPFVRILPKLIGQMSLVIRGWKPSKGKNVSAPLLAGVIVLAVISSSLNGILADAPALLHAIGSSVLQLLLFFGLIAATRLVPRFGRIWRFHGGEHQAIAAYEAGLDLTVEQATTRTLYHPRCGTNLATLAMILMVPGMVLGSIISGFAGYLITLAVPLPAMCIAFEIVMLGQNRLKAVLWPGLAFQRLTVATPGLKESRAGIVALRAALAEHVKVEAVRAAARAATTTRVGTVARTSVGSHPAS